MKWLKVPSNLWKIGALNHVAIAVPDLQKAVSLYRDVLGGNCSAPLVFSLLLFFLQKYFIQEKKKNN